MGEVFAGRYELIDQIGAGGMGSVWRVRDLRRQCIVAAKVLGQSDAGSLLRFMREQGMRIHHEGVVTPLGWAGEDDRVLFTMPIVEGGSVADLMKRHGALPPRYVAELMRQMLAALGAVHDSHVVHRDVKPANLLLDATGTARPHLWLTDFGVAVATDAPRLTSQSVVMGTPGYLAPEQLRGADPDPRADLYAAGMVGLQMLTGHRPRPQIRTERLDLPPQPSQAPDALWQLLIRLADPDVTGRPRDAHEAGRALEVPELAWQPQGLIQVCTAMPPLNGVSEGEFLRPGQQFDPTVVAGPSTMAPAADGGTAAYRADRTAQLGAPPRHEASTVPAGRVTTAGPVEGVKSARTPIAVLIAAPLAALLVIGLMVWAPWTANGSQKGDAVSGGTCAWHDVGTFEPDQHGQRLECSYSGGKYVWRTPSGTG